MKSTPEHPEPSPVLGAPIRPDPESGPDTWTRVSETVWRNDRTGQMQTRQPIPPIDWSAKPIDWTKVYQP